MTRSLRTSVYISLSLFLILFPFPFATHYLFQPILDPYDYSCIVSAVWIYPVIYIYNFSMHV